MSELERLIAALGKPGLYDHPVSRVETMETHISVVLLAGDYAYKFKKPVDFGFVDFTSLAKRRHYCEEELRLNRRFAPELYLDVVAIRGSPDAPSLRGAGEAIEYAVRMKRFRQEALLDRCIRGDGVTTAMMEAFAARVAAVHTGADAADAGDDYGTPEVIRTNLLECGPPIRRAETRVEGVVELLEATERRADALAPKFDQRLRSGRVRECHGDLHLGNLFLDDGRICAFDCIEFNPALSWIDVANEIAFMTMDLRYHDRIDHARRFRNAYLDATGDHAMLGVLRFYEVYRALVRAKVASLREAEHPGAGMNDIREHLDLADRLMHDTPELALTITCGLSGSGKTFHSGNLVAESEAIRIRSDVERDRCLEDQADRYAAASIQRVYDCLLEKAGEILASGYPVIVDATFMKKFNRDRFRRLADGLGIPFRILYCTAPETELRRRIETRARAGTDASEAGLAVLDHQFVEFEPPAGEEERFVIDTP